MPTPFLRRYRLTTAYVVLVVVVAIGFYTLGQRQATERQDRLDATAAILKRVCAQAREGRRISNANWTAQREAWVAARDARHGSALLAKAAGNLRQAAVDQAAADSYQQVARAITIPSATFQC